MEVVEFSRLEIFKLFNDFMKEDSDNRATSNPIFILTDVVVFIY